jgi:integrase
VPEGASRANTGTSRRSLALAAKEAGLGHVRAHDLRHAATSLLLRSGDLATVSQVRRPRKRWRDCSHLVHAIGSPAEQAARIAEAMKAADFGR